MSEQDQVSYGRRARLRTAISSKAAELADSARGLVPTYADGYAVGGEFVQAAASIAADARQLLELAVAYERRRGTSWEIIGDTFGISRQAAHDRFADAEKRLNKALIETWLLGDGTRGAGLPYGAIDTAAAAGILDRWVIGHLQAADPMARKPEDDPERLRPVSHNLPPMDTLENSALVLAAAELVAGVGASVALLWRAEAEKERWHMLELGLARRKVEFYERLLADELAGKRTGTDVDQTRDLLVGARARLAELEEAERGKV